MYGPAAPQSAADPRQSEAPRGKMEETGGGRDEGARVAFGEEKAGLLGGERGWAQTARSQGGRPVCGKRRSTVAGRAGGKVAPKARGKVRDKSNAGALEKGSAHSHGQASDKDHSWPIPRPASPTNSPRERLPRLSHAHQRPASQWTSAASKRQAHGRLIVTPMGDITSPALHRTDSTL